jgi:hypothetical protein
VLGVHLKASFRERTTTAVAEMNDRRRAQLDSIQ